MANFIRRAIILLFVTNCLSKKPAFDCKQTEIGTTYIGKRSITNSGESCIEWKGYSDADFPDGTMAAAKNYCRNPDNDIAGPWCLTALGNDYCTIPLCPAENTKKSGCGDSSSRKNGFSNTIKKVAISAVVGAGAVAAVPFVLSAAGFGAAGVAAGSVAAAMQPILGGGAIFGALQSAGAAGLGILMKAVVGTAGATFAGYAASENCE